MQGQMVFSKVNRNVFPDLCLIFSLPAGLWVVYEWHLAVTATWYVTKGALLYLYQGNMLAM